MSKIYNIVFNSTIGITANSSIESYYFDWSKLPQGKYLCNFTFSSGVMNYANVYAPNVFIDLGCANNYIAQNPSGSGSNVSSFIGALLFNGTGVATYVYADMNSNPPFYLDSRPCNNQVTVSIVTNTTNQSTAFNPVPTNYTLTLMLQLIE